jgi:hypothetical protein
MLFGALTQRCVGTTTLTLEDGTDSNDGKEESQLDATLVVY